MSGAQVAAERRRRDRFSAWMGTVFVAISFLWKTFSDGFEVIYLTALLMAMAWLATEYQREWEATP